MLVNFLTEAVDACHNAGLEDVANVCGMGVTIKAMKLLSVSEKTPLFSFAAIFDPPHLLKCMCLFLIHNVPNVECEITVNGEQLTGTAQWDVMLKLYEVEKCNVYLLLPKVTEAYSAWWPGYNDS